MRKGTKEPPGAVAGLLHIVALGGLVYLGVELLLGACVAVPAAVPGLAVTRLPPLLTVLHVWTWSATVFIFPW